MPDEENKSEEVKEETKKEIEKKPRKPFDWRPTEEKQKAFLEHFLDCGMVREATIRAGIGDCLPYEWAAKDPKFKEALEEAKQIVVGKMESEAYRRAVHGVEKPVFQGGRQVGTITQYSDNLLMFMLKGAAPEKYKDRISVEDKSKDSTVLILPSNGRELAVPDTVNSIPVDENKGSSISDAELVDE